MAPIVSKPDADNKWPLDDLPRGHVLVCDDGTFDVIVPGSGGKDSVTVAWKMKNE